MNQKIARFVAENAIATPCLIVDLDVVAANYAKLQNLLPTARIFYAVKANPAPEILTLLMNLGAYFDTASIGEIALLLELGADPARLSFGNTIKKERDIAYAYKAGLRLFAFDSAAELAKLARASPGAQVYCRLLMLCEGAEWPLSRKFGCSAAMAEELLRQAVTLGLEPVGVSFHVGSQQTDPGQWDLAIGRVADIFQRLETAGIKLRLINLGGGFSIHYRRDVPDTPSHAAAISRALQRHFGNDLPALILEPGRSLVGSAGVIEAEIVLIATKGDDDPRRWVYLDIGKFGGLAETMDEAIQYQITTKYNGAAAAPVVLAGPTCDSADILYEKAEYNLPLALAIGDRVSILGTGAYTSTYSAVWFNGFAPLKTICI